MEAINTNIVYAHLEYLPKKYNIVVEQGGSRCFTGETLVNTVSGYKKIKDVHIGEKVYTYDNILNKITTNKVIDKFIYKEEQPLLLIKLKDGEQIVCTPRHRFLFHGKWTSAIELARRRVERGKRYEWKIFNKQLREIKNFELQKFRTRKNNEACSNEKRQVKKEKSLFKNYDKKEWEIYNGPNTQTSSTGIYMQSRKQIYGKSYKWKDMGQQSSKFRMGNSFRKLFTFFQNRVTKTQERRTEWYEQINNFASERDCYKVRPFEIYCKNVSKGIQSFVMHNKDNIGAKRQEDEVARCNFRYKDQNFKEINLEEIESIDLFISKQKVYDLEVEYTHSYCITRDNIIVHNSGKTYNILTWIISKCVTQWNDKIIDIVRKSFPSLRSSAMFDFLEILRKNSLYSEKNHNKTENIYKIGSNTIRFFSCDDPQKMRGPGRDILFCNEANELKLEDFRQLNMRTRELTILDYNPSDEFHWIYDNVIPRDDCKFYKTTFKDNPFLPDRIKNEILRYKETDENYWRIYGLGERGISETTIYPKWELCDNVPNTDVEFYGLDFGYNHPTVLTRLTLDENCAYIEQLMYERYLTGTDIIKRLKNLNISPSATIYADCARPELIQQISGAGFNIIPTKKGTDSVKDGIDIVKRHKLFIHKNAVDIIKEIKSYKWKVDKDDRVLDEPVKLNDDGMDSMRYAFNFMLKQDTFGDILSFSL